jgi:aspartyl-tRNA(Asn)/glutamyl-tRNA(Gln) amidotransferase subunit A
VADAFDRALEGLTAAGAEITRMNIAEVEMLPMLNARGGIAAAEAFDWHSGQLSSRGSEYDPRVAGRIRQGADVGSAELGELYEERLRMIEVFKRAMLGFDALLAPTVPVIAPPIAAFDNDEDYLRLNLQLLRNPSLFNFLDGCAISIPIHPMGTAPVGMMLAAPGGFDRPLLTTAMAVEAVVGTNNQPRLQ